MCGPRTLLAALFLGLPALGPAGPALAQSSDLAIFATCAGRFSALMEHQWLLSDPGSDETGQQRAAMLSLVDAVTRPGEEPRALNLRIEAKVAQATLYSAASFDRNEKTATQAARRSEELIGACRALLLG